MKFKRILFLVTLLPLYFLVFSHFSISLVECREKASTVCSCCEDEMSLSTSQQSFPSENCCFFNPSSAPVLIDSSKNLESRFDKYFSLISQNTSGDRFNQKRDAFSIQSSSTLFLVPLFILKESYLL